MREGKDDYNFVHQRSMRGMFMNDFGRILVIIGLTLFFIGVLILLAGRIFPNLGNLPGDFSYEGDGFKVFVPFATMIVISILGTILLNIVTRFFR